MTYVQGSAASHIIYAWRGLFTTFRTPRLNSCILFLIRHDHGKKVSMESPAYNLRICHHDWSPKILLISEKDPSRSRCPNSESMNSVHV